MDAAKKVAVDHGAVTESPPNGRQEPFLGMISQPGIINWYGGN